MGGWIDKTESEYLHATGVIIHVFLELLLASQEGAELGNGHWGPVLIPCPLSCLGEECQVGKHCKHYFPSPEGCETSC